MWETWGYFTCLEQFTKILSVCFQWNTTQKYLLLYRYIWFVQSNACVEFKNKLVIRQKGESQNKSNKKAKHAKIVRKTNISYPLICTCTSAYQNIRNVRFSGYLVFFAFLLPPFWDSLVCLITDDGKNRKLFKSQGTSCYDKNIALGSSSEICQTHVPTRFPFSMYMKKRR